MRLILCFVEDRVTLPLDRKDNVTVTQSYLRKNQRFTVDTIFIKLNNTQLDLYIYNKIFVESIFSAVEWMVGLTFC